MMDGTAWHRLLIDATERVQEKVSTVARRGDASKALEVGASGDITLLADREAENALFGVLDRIDGLRIVSEEAGNRGDQNAPFVAVVDPLDGSSNFARGVPFYCTSVAIAHGNSLGSVGFGIVRNLLNGDVYWAEKGRGSMKNGKRLTSSGVSTLGDAVLDVDLSRGPPELTARTGPLISAAKRQVHFGANALELCFLAEGRVDAFVDLRKMMRATDFAAAYLISEEAGAVVTDHQGKTLDPELNLAARFPVVASGNEVLHQKILRLVSG